MKGLNCVMAAVVYWCWIFELVNGDVAADRKECTQAVTALVPCLTFVQGNGGNGAPSLDCCRATRMLLDSNFKCLCILLKDRSSVPEVSSLNITTAIRLPFLCGGSVNATHCIDLLQLPTNSPEAQYFMQLEKTVSAFPISPSSGSVGAGGGSGSAKSGWTEPRGVRLVGGCVFLLSSWFFMLVTTSIWN